jgi:hypothetical protein
MATIIVDTIQKNLGYGTLQKVDPNTQEIKDKYEHSSIEKLGQAAIPAVLTALYKFTRTEAGCKRLLTGTEKEDWLSVIFSDREKEVVEKVAHYSGVTENQAESHMENIADEAVRIVREQAGNSPEKVKMYISSQRHNILVYLPASLNMGDMLNDETLDDKTNKMEGPVSNFMHKIENTFSDGDRKKGVF